jgi:enamine deaminase RidA (YjgF/YER057c/UK114 family)
MEHPAVSVDDSISARVTALGLSLPPPSMPAGNFSPWRISRGGLYIGGQGPRLDGQVMYAGRVGVDLTIEQGQAAAQLCAINVLGHLVAATGDRLSAVAGMVRLAGVINCGPDFVDHGKVLNGASDLLRQVLGDKGDHVRIATGAVSLPMNFAVEIEASFELE